MMVDAVMHSAAEHVIVQKRTFYKVLFCVN